MLVKVCGLKDSESNRKIAALPGLDLAGFIFYHKSPRFTETAFETTRKERVGVFVNAHSEEIEEAVFRHKLTTIQLHGNEAPEHCRTLSEKVKTIKAFGISTSADFEQTNAYEGTVDCFLFDTKTENHGGSGKQFDWTILRDYKGNTAFFLSGGISPDSVENLKHVKHPQFIGVDLNSKFETAPGIKDYDLVKQFIEQLKA